MVDQDVDAVMDVNEISEMFLSAASAAVEITTKK